MFEKINADISTNYTDRKMDNGGAVLECGYSSDCPKNIWFTIQLSQDRPDDTLTINVRLDDLFELIGKTIVRESEED